MPDKIPFNASEAHSGDRMGIDPRRGLDSSGMPPLAMADPNVRNVAKVATLTDPLDPLVNPMGIDPRRGLDSSGMPPLAMADPKKIKFGHYGGINPPENPELRSQLDDLTKSGQIGGHPNIAGRLEENPDLAKLELGLIGERNKLLEQSELLDLVKGQLRMYYMPSVAISILRLEPSVKEIFRGIRDSGKLNDDDLFELEGELRTTLPDAMLKKLNTIASQ